MHITIHDGLSQSEHLLNDRSITFLDCRQPETFLRLRHRQSINIPCQDLFARMHELSPAHQALFILIDADQSQQCQQFFFDKQYHQVTLIIWQSDCIDWLQQHQLLASGPLDAAQQQLKLWRASALVADFLDMYDSEANTTKRGLDLGCGSGRDMLAMAQHGWQMTGVDYNAGSLERCQLTAAEMQLAIATRCLDLEQSASSVLAHAFDAETFDAITVVRYLHRPLFDEMIHLLAPGGFIIYQTFMQGCERISRPKNPRFLLKPDELKQIFHLNAGFELLQDQVYYLADGRPMSAFIAKKPL